ncbi:MAG TPA: hypothetical protein VGH28_22855 [Polyangiaceae bacterium]|jgi:hypothetical protein
MGTLDAWTERLSRAAISEVDRRAVAASESAREMVLERLDAHRGESAERAFEDRDALHGWTLLGRVLADAGASPTLAAQVVDTLAQVEGQKSFEGWAASARAALVEAFVAAQRELADKRAFASWRFPKCVVRLDETTAAVAAGFPDDDSDELSRWADEVAAALAKMGIRRVFSDGSPRARAALESALAAVGVEHRARGASSK